MSSKGKSSAETSDGATLVPRLRFPEFQTADGWEEISLKKLARPVTDRATTGDANNVLSLSGEHGLVLQSDYFGKKIAGDSTDRYLKIRKDDFVYNDRTTKASSFGTIKRLSNYSGGIVSPIYKCFRFQPSENPAFWEWYFESGSHDPALGGLVNEGARTGRFNISVTQFLSTNAWRPDEAEQHKIANCLDSADALIEAQERKVEALRAHKKGLMQQLFPQEGETQPRLRFPEFEETGEWEEKPFSAIVDLISGVHLSPDEYSDSGEVPYFSGPSDFTDEASDAKKWTASTKSSARNGDTLITVKGSGVGEVWFSKLPAVALGRQLMAVRPKKGQISQFVFQFLLTKKRRFEVLGAGNLIPGISRPDILDLRSFFPKPPEQRRIADCFTSLGDLIAVETQKLNTLKSHKKGLMQQLFPMVGEDDA